VDPAYDNISEGVFLRDKSLFEAALHHAAAMLIRSDLVAIGHASSKNELSVLGEGLRPRAIRLVWRV